MGNVKIAEKSEREKKRARHAVPTLMSLPETTFERFEQYPFDADPVFQVTARAASRFLCEISETDLPALSVDLEWSGEHCWSVGGQVARRDRRGCGQSKGFLLQQVCLDSIDLIVLSSKRVTEVRILSTLLRSSGETINWADYVRYRQEHPAPAPPSIPTLEAHPVLDDTVANLDTAPQATVPPPPTQLQPQAPGQELHGAAPPLSFSSIADLISSGKTHLIPNNEIIPDKLSVRRSPLASSEFDLSAYRMLTMRWALTRYVRTRLRASPPCRYRRSLGRGMHRSPRRQTN